MYFQIPLMVLVTLPAIDGLKPAWREASSNLGGTTWTYWRRVGLPVLAPSMLGGFLLLFANSFSAYATVYALNNQANVVPVKISFGLSGDVGVRTSEPYALATWMIIVIAHRDGRLPVAPQAGRTVAGGMSERAANDSSDQRCRRRGRVARLGPEPRADRGRDLLHRADPLDRSSGAAEGADAAARLVDTLFDKWSLDGV